MKMQILVPQYKEDDQVISPLLNSIAIQQGIDFNDLEVIIVNDGSDVFLTDEFINSFPFKIHYHKSQHRGVSATRNICLDFATAEYIMYCDADDMFSCNYALWLIFREIENSHFDGLITKFVEETYDDQGNRVYIYHEMDNTFVHGKVYRRQYLEENNIRWDEDLLVHEDSYFNKLVQVCSDKIIYIQDPLYLWRWNNNSVCRSDIEYYMLKTYCNLIDANEALIDELLRRGYKEHADINVAGRIFETYYTLNKPQWLEEKNTEYREKVEKRIYDFLKKYLDAWNQYPVNKKMELSEQMRNRQIQKGMYMEVFTFDSWIKHLLEVYA